MSSDRGEATRDRIVEAAIETVSELGFAHTTARAVADRGGFNPALIFYHFGSVDELLMEAFARVSARQVVKYKDAIGGVTSPSELVAMARRLHDDDLQTGAVTATTQLMAAATEPDRARVLLDQFDDWIRLVEEGLKNAASTMPLAAIVPPREAAYAIAALFLGIELMSRLDPERSEAPKVFDMLEAAARLVENLGPMLEQVGPALQVSAPAPGE